MCGEFRTDKERQNNMRKMTRLSTLISCFVIVVTSESLTNSAKARPADPQVPYKKHDSLAGSCWQCRLLPGCDRFTFTIYGCPGQLESLRELVSVMQDRGLGNGFDPGPFGTAASRPLFEYLVTVGWPIISYPPAYGEFQVKEGRSILSDQDEEALQVLDRAGLFNALQLGEWGYHFHNLSIDEGWFRNVYGEDFEKFRGLIKPAGLAGYDSKPQTRRACYEAVKDYYLTRNRFMRGRNMSVTGHSHYEAYAAEWGTPLVGLELGENIAFTQSKIAFARGAARQWGKPWSVQVSPWFHGSCTTSGPLRREGRYARGLDAGHSLNFYKRLWLHAWFAGAAMVTPENSLAIFFDNAEPPWKLTSHGRAAAEAFDFMQAHERGIPYTPVAIVLDHLAGYNAYKGKPWGIIENSPGDLEIRDLFEHQLFPGSDHIHANPFPENPEQSYLRPTPFGEMFDVLLSSARADVLRSYPVILLVGDITFDADFTCRLFRAVRAGSRLLLHPRHAKALGDDCDRLKGTGVVEVLAESVNATTCRPSAISNDRLARLNAEYLPVAITGDPVQYQVNRTSRGWSVELVNNQGVVKKPDQPAVVDPEGSARIRLRPRVAIESVRRWSGTDDEELEPAPTMSITLGSGETVFVELVAN